MKRIISFVVASLVLVSVSMIAFAANEGTVNSYEQQILKKLSSKVTIDGKTFQFSAEDLKKAENYFKTVDITEAQAEQAIANIDQGIALLKEEGTADIKALSAEGKAKMLEYANNAASVVDLSVTFDATTKTFAVKDAQGAVVIENKAPIKTTGSQTEFFVAIGLVAVVVLGVSVSIFGRSFAKRKVVCR